jgi:hypothetical protein
MSPYRELAPGHQPKGYEEGAEEARDMHACPHMGGVDSTWRGRSQSVTPSNRGIFCTVQC